MNKIKILFVVLGILLGVNAMSAQKQQRQHLKFMGIPITGTINAFADKVKAKNPNWVEEERTDSTILFKGKFHLFENASIEIKKSTLGNYVGEVGVFSLTPDKESKSFICDLYYFCLFYLYRIFWIVICVCRNCVCFLYLAKKYKNVKPTTIKEFDIVVIKWEMRAGNVSWVVDGDMRGMRVSYEDYAEVERQRKHEFEKSERARQDL